MKNYSKKILNILYLNRGKYINFQDLYTIFEDYNVLEETKYIKVKSILDILKEIDIIEYKNGNCTILKLTNEGLEFYAHMWRNYWKKD